MRKRLLKKSEVLREGYIKGLRKAQGIISRMLSESSGGNGRDGLLLAIRNGDIKSVERLLENGVDVNSKPRRGFMRSPWLCK